MRFGDQQNRCVYLSHEEVCGREWGAHNRADFEGVLRGSQRHRKQPVLHVECGPGVSACTVHRPVEPEHDESEGDGTSLESATKVGPYILRGTREMERE